MKRTFCILMICSLVLCAACASASGAPTSQFGFKGWPYRQDSGCGTVCDTCGSASCDGSCAQPTAAPQATDRPAATSKPTSAPIATAKPTAAPKPTAQPSTGNSDYTSVSVAAQEANMLALLNADRAANGLPALALDAELSRLARIKSCDMKQNNYFAHTSPTLGNAADLLRANGYSFSGVGENIAHHSTVVKAEAAFMSSSGHRTNILGSQWTKVGIGVCMDNNGFVYVTQLFVR